MAIGITDNTFQLNIVSAEGTLFSGPAYALAVSGADGELGIRPVTLRFSVDQTGRDRVCYRP